MRVLLELFDALADGTLGRRWARRAGWLMTLVVVGVGLKVGLADWAFDQYVAFRANKAEEIIERILDPLLPTTTTTAGP